MSLEASQATPFSSQAAEPQGAGVTEVPDGLEVRDGVVMYNPARKALFVDWWTLTPWGVGVAEEDSQYPDPNWDSELRRAGIWEMYEQGARVEDGEPVVLCMMCDRFYKHPNNKRTGSGNLIRHVKTQTCKAAAASRLVHPAVARLNASVSAHFDTDVMHCSFFLWYSLLSITNKNSNLIRPRLVRLRPSRSPRHLGSSR